MEPRTIQPHRARPVRETRGPRRAHLLAMGALAFGSLGITGCGVDFSPEDLGALNCGPDNETIVDLVDVSGTGRGEVLTASRRSVIQEHVMIAADCEKPLVIIAYGASAAAHEVVFADELHIEGSTERARDRDLDDAVAEQMQIIDHNLAEATKRISADGSDVTGALVLAADQAAARTHSTLNITVFTDGVNTSGPFANNYPEFSVDDTANALEGPPIVDLTSHHVVFAGVGRVADDPQPPSDYLDSLRQSTQSICESTGATCRVSTTTEVTQ